MATTDDTELAASSASRGAPRPARVPANLWTDIEVDDVGALEPVATVTVVVTGDDPDDRLPLTLAALTRQTYPASLTDVVLAVPGAGAAARQAAGQLEVSHDPVGGGARSRLAAALQSARGEVLLLLPAGAVAVPELVEAHARWHHAVADAVSTGVSRAVEGGSIRAGDVAEVRGADELEALFASLRAPDRRDEQAIEVYLERTRNLTERRPDIFRAAARGSVAMRADTVRAAGGAGDEPDDAMARLDLAYRLDCAGCVFVSERRAVTFEPYPYEGPALQGAADDLLAKGGRPGASPDPRIADVIPAAGFRSRDSSRVHSRPAMAVNLSVGDETAAEVLEAIDAVLRGHFQDLELRVTVGDGHPEREVIEEACASDPRIVIGPPSTEGRSEAAYQVFLPTVSLTDERSFEDIYDLMTQEGVGALHVTVPGELPRHAMVEAMATGPLARARRVAAEDGEEVEVVLGRLFGERWVSGVEVSIRRLGTSEPQVTEHGPLSRATDLDHERTQHLRHQSRAAVNQARADRYAQRADRERLKARAERERAARIEARIAAVETSRAHRLMRPLRRAAGLARARLRR